MMRLSAGILLGALLLASPALAQPPSFPPAFEIRDMEAGEVRLHVRVGGAGLAVVTAVQAFINMGVAVSLLPAKGMTLPFISYGGSSLFAVALTMGFALAVTRQRPQLRLATRDDPSFFASSMA